MVIVLALIVSTQGFLVIQGMFLLRQDYIAEVLCVNKDRPELNCDGTCFLHDRMEHHHEHAPEAPPPLEIAFSVQAMIPEAGLLLEIPSPLPSWTAPPLVDTGVLLPDDRFRPPRA